MLSRSLGLLTIAGLGAALAFVPGDGDAAVPAASGTVYGGVTSKDTPFALILSADRRRVSQELFYVDAKCSDGSELPYYAKVTFKPRVLPRSGTFAYAASQSRSNPKAVLRATERIRGRIRGATASGTFSVTLELLDKASGAKRETCQSGTLRWRASSAPGHVYVGQTGAGGPVVVQLNRARSEITAFRAGWIGSCSKSGPLGMGEHLSEIKVARSGSFADSLKEDEPINGGGKRTVEISLSGKIAAARASGVYRYSSTDRSAAGKAGDVCDSTDVRWSARSSAKR